jgi:hypothetical protein
MIKKQIILFSILILLTLIFFNSCLSINVKPINPDEQAYETMIKYVATLYNKGQYYTKDDVLKFLSDPSYTYPENVVAWYRYFLDLNSYAPKTFKSLTATQTEKFDNYVKEFNLTYWITDNNLISSVTYDVKDYPGYYDLLNKVKNIMTTETNAFWLRAKELYPDFTTANADVLAEYIVDSAIKTSMSRLNFSRSYNDSVFESNVKIEKYIIKPELLLAFAMAETSFEPFAYRAEQNSSDKIYAVSLGLSQMLLNIGLIKDDVGLSDDEVYVASGNYTFGILNSNYFSSKYKASDLFKVQTADLFKAVFLQLLFDKIIRENWVAD